MDEYRAWKKGKRKRKLRMLAVILSVCVLFAAYPEIPAGFSVSAEAEELSEDQYVAGFSALPEETAKQNVPTGTALEELLLPDTLEAAVRKEKDKDPAQDAEQKPSGDEEKKPEEGEVNPPGDAEGVPEEDENPSEDEEGVPGEGEGAPSEDTEETPEGSEENVGNPSEDTEGTSEESEGTPTEDAERTSEESEENTGNPFEDTEENAGENEARAQTHTVSVQEYYAPRVLAVKTLSEETGKAQPENERGGGKNTTPDEAEEEIETETVLIEGVTWESAPSYDAEMAGEYVFAAVLPEGYVLSDGVSVPEITVTVEEVKAGPRRAARASIISSGECGKDGNNLTWTLHDDGMLTISGNGAMKDYDDTPNGAAPWYASRNSIKKVIVESGVTAIGSHAFYQCASVTEITMPESVTAMEWRAFYGCESLTDITIPKGVTSLERAVFTGCKNLTNIIIPNGVTNIGSGAFQGCSKLSEITIPDSVTTIAQYAFQECASLTEITIPDQVDRIEQRTFYRCTNLKGIDIPDSVETIAFGAFAYCTALEEITIPGGVTNMGDKVFLNCSALKTVTVLQKEPPAVEGTSCFNGATSLTAIHVPCGSQDAYETAAYWSGHADKIQATAHNYQYTAGEDSITESCANNCGHSATAMLSAKSGVDLTKLTYTGSSITPLTVIYSDNWVGTGDQRPTEAAIVYRNNTNAGTARGELSIGGKTVTVYFTIKTASMGKEVKTNHYTGEYDGEAHSITVTIPEGAEITYRTSENPSGSVNPSYTDVGTYTVSFTVTKSNYTTILGQGTVTITPRSISDATVTLDGELTYNGSGQTKRINNVTVEAGSKTLELAEGTDYTVSGNEKTDAGTYTMTLTGQGNFTDTKEAEFRIQEKSLTDSMVILAAGPHYYTGSAVTPAVTVKDGGKMLVKDTDYTVAYADNTNVGTAKITVTGKGNYKGKAEKTFTIAYQPLPAGKTLADYVDISPDPVNGWYNEDITLTPKNGCGVGETDADAAGGGSVTISQETNSDGSTKIIYIKDENGNIYQTTFPYKLDKTAPGFNVDPAVTDRTQESVEVTFTSSEGGKVYWVIDTGTKPTAGQVAEQGALSGNVQENEGGGSETFILDGLAPGQTHTVYVVLEDAAGNLSEVKEISFTTLQAPPEITLADLIIDHEKETVKIPDSVGTVEVYTDPDDPEGSRITPDADGFLPVEPGEAIYIRYPEITGPDGTTPAGAGVRIDLPGRAETPAAKQAVVTDQGITVKNKLPGEEYVLVKKGSVPAGQEPDWDDANTTGEFTGLDPNTEYELWVRKAPTDQEFASEPAKTAVRTQVTVKETVVAGDGAGKPGNTVKEPQISGAGSTPGVSSDPGTVTFTGEYGEEYTPVITMPDGRERIPELTWEEQGGNKKGRWEYSYDVSDDDSEVGITVTFRPREETGIAVTPGNLTLYADDAANRSAADQSNVAPLTEWLSRQCDVRTSYDNGTEGSAQNAAYTTTDVFVPKGGTYRYTVHVGSENAAVTLTVKPVNAAVKQPAMFMKQKKDGGYTAAEVDGWLPKKAEVTYTGDNGHTDETQELDVTWNTASLGEGFGSVKGEQSVNGTVALPKWATGENAVGIIISFVDKYVLNDTEMGLAIDGWAYGDRSAPQPRGSVTVPDTNAVYTYDYSADGGTTWTAADSLPKSPAGHIVPGTYQVRMTYAGDAYMGSRTAVFTVEKKALTIEKGTLAVENRLYDGTTDAVLKEGGQAELLGVAAGDQVTLGGTLSAVFTKAGPQNNIPVIVSGFVLEGRDVGYYKLENDTLTLKANITKKGGGSSSGGGKDDKGENVGSDGSGDTDNNGGDADNGGGSGAGADGKDDKGGTGGQDGTGSNGTGGQDGTGNNGTGGKDGTGNNGTGGKGVTGNNEADDATSNDGGQTDNGGKDTNNDTRGGGKNGPDGGSSPSQEAAATITEGRIVIMEEASGGTAEDMAGEMIATGNVSGMAASSTTLQMRDDSGNDTGAVIVTVVCEDNKYAAGVRDTAAVANAVLSPEQMELVEEGGIVEVRVDVKDISQTALQQDKEVIEKGLAQYREEIPGLVLGNYIDISIYIKIGDSDWDGVSATEEPIEVVIGIPEELHKDGQEYYIIRSHDGEYTLMRDTDEMPDTITICTDRFSCYAIAYVPTSGGAVGKCGLCHICPTIFGVCCFLWLAALMAAAGIGVAVVMRKRKVNQ